MIINKKKQPDATQNIITIILIQRTCIGYDSNLRVLFKVKGTEIVI